MPNWKKLIVSGSDAALSNINVTNSVTASAFKGDGSALTNIPSALNNQDVDLGTGDLTATEIKVADKIRHDGDTDTNITFTNNEIKFFAGGTRTVNIESGNLTINDTGADYNFKVESVNNDRMIFVDAGNDKVGIGVSGAPSHELSVNGTVSASAYIGDGSGLTGVSVAEATTIVDSFSSQTSVTTTHNFGTKNVLVNVYDSNDAYIIPSSITTTNDNTVTTTFNVSTSGRVVVAKGGHVVGGTSANPQHNSIGVGTAASTTAGEIRATNDITAFYSSDKRLKNNITNIESPLDKLNKINGVTFDWIETPGVHSHVGSDIGVIAQEIEEVLPDIVTTRDNGYKAVKYDKLVALLIESNKELNKKVEELQTKVDNLLKT